MKPGPARTDVLTKIFRNMTDLAPSLVGFSVDDFINETENKGKRLFGYSYLYALPAIGQLPQLVNSVIRLESTPFGQYWGILTIGKVVSSAGTNAVSTDVVEQLNKFFQSLKPGTDRWNELKSIVEQL
jgi:hypothetical protein